MRSWWRKAPEKPAVQFVRTEPVNSGTFHIHQGPDLAQAMTFLRRTPVTEPLVYVVVETPEGNIGRDFIYIFHEPAGTPIEHGPRQPRPEPIPSATHCAWCGFYVEAIDVSSQLPDTTGISTVTLVLGIDDILNHGHGFRCKHCATLQCGWCSGLSPGSDEKEARCRTCGATMQTHRILPPVTPWTFCLQIYTAGGEWATLLDPHSNSRVPEYCAVVHAARDRLADVAREEVFDKTRSIDLPRRVVFWEGPLSSGMNFSNAYGVIDEGGTEVRPYTIAAPTSSAP